MGKKIAIFLPSMWIGGAEKITLRLIKGFSAKSIEIDLIIATPYIKLKDNIPHKVNVIYLNSRKATFSLFKLMKYIREQKPNIILSHLSRANRIVLLAKYLLRDPVKVYVVEHTAISGEKKRNSVLSNIVSSLSYRYLYDYAEEIIHVSAGAARDLEKLFYWKNGRVKVIFNPVVDIDLINRKYDIPHRWFGKNQPPVAVSIGRIDKPKDYITLIKAIAIVRGSQNIRLLILGDGKMRQSIQKYINESGLTELINILGFIDNPFAYLSHANLFILSSESEALPTVIIEALACGCPVISTDCPYGPSEILENGKYGRLVPIKDHNALAQAILQVIKYPPNSGFLRERAMEFSIDKSVKNYMQLLGI